MPLNLELEDAPMITEPSIPTLIRKVETLEQEATTLRLKYQEVEHKYTSLSQDMAETNIALAVMMKQYELSKKQLEQQILSNLSEQVFPIIERLKKSGLRDSQKNYIEIIETGMREILSPCGPGIGLILARLTSTEQTVANLVKQGKTTKEIAAFLQVATGTVNKHRENIRKKIGIANKKKHLEKTLLATT